MWCGPAARNVIVAVGQGRFAERHEPRARRRGRRRRDERRAVQRIHHYVEAVAGSLLERLGIVAIAEQDRRSADRFERAQRIGVSPRADDVRGAEDLRALHRDAPDAAGRTEYEHVIAGCGARERRA